MKVKLFHTLGLGVKRLAEFHDVQAALTESRADWGRGIGFACRNLQLDKADDFLSHLKLTPWVQTHLRMRALPSKNKKRGRDYAKKI